MKKEYFKNVVLIFGIASFSISIGCLVSLLILLTSWKEGYLQTVLILFSLTISLDAVSFLSFGLRSCLKQIESNEITISELKESIKKLNDVIERLEHKEEEIGVEKEEETQIEEEKEVAEEGGGEDNFVCSISDESNIPLITEVKPVAQEPKKTRKTIFEEFNGTSHKLRIDGKRITVKDLEEGLTEEYRLQDLEHSRIETSAKGITSIVIEFSKTNVYIPFDGKNDFDEAERIVYILRALNEDKDRYIYEDEEETKDEPIVEEETNEEPTVEEDLSAEEAKQRIIEESLNKKPTAQQQFVMEFEGTYQKIRVNRHFMYIRDKDKGLEEECKVSNLTDVSIMSTKSGRHTLLFEFFDSIYYIPFEGNEKLDEANELVEYFHGLVRKVIKKK